MWLLSTLGRIFLSGFQIVQFRDFFLSDLLSSMTYSFIALQSAACITVTFPNGRTKCSLYDFWLPSVVTGLPAWWRLLQCFRRYYDNGVAHPHLTNSIKYILSLGAISFSVMTKFNSRLWIEVLWILISLIASAYSYAWDIFFDWGLGNANAPNKYLRKELSFPIWFYYMSMVLNLLFRFTWMILLAPNYWSYFTEAPVIVYCLACLEMFRRCIWVLIRMENEHSNNVGQFRVTKDLPLPFEIGESLP
jgi:hypothetical protein